MSLENLSRMYTREMEELNELNEFKNLMLSCSSALKEINTKIEILNDEFKLIHQYNPIEYTKSRVKTVDSIFSKLKRKGFEVTFENISQQIHDIAGTRIVCSFTSDIYRLADMIEAQNDIKIIKIKDYIKNPKENGYRSYHMLIEIPIFFTNRVTNVVVELQIRTIAMDFWASLEHKIYYKFEGNAPESIKKELMECATMANALDARMLGLNNQIKKYK